MSVEEFGFDSGCTDKFPTKLTVTRPQPRDEAMFIRDDSMGVYHVVPDAGAADAPETILSHVATRPVQRVLIEKISQRSVVSLQCDGGSVVGDVPTSVLKELDRRAMLPSRLGSYLKEMGYL